MSVSDTNAVLKLVEQARQAVGVKQTSYSSMDLLMHAYFFEASASGYDVKVRVAARRQPKKPKKVKKR